MREPCLGFVTKLGNLLEITLLKNPQLNKSVEEQGWKEFTSGYLNDSNTEDNKKLGDHFKDQKEKELLDDGRPNI